jgi:hypothetical protein
MKTVEMNGIVFQVEVLSKMSKADFKRKFGKSFKDSEKAHEVLMKMIGKTPETKVEKAS